VKHASKSKLEALNALTTETVALFHRMRAVADEVHEEATLTAGMRGVMISLEKKGPQTVPQMARARPVSRQHIQTIVNSLRSQGMVESLENPAHKRSSLVVLTAGGRKKLASMKKREEQLLSQAAIPVSKKDLRAAVQTLQAVRELFEGPEWQLLLR
jgi:DNA-binding MarR family transcriptional regulator